MPILDASDTADALPASRPDDGDRWQYRQRAFDPATAARDESLFALANGALGVRGGLEEMASDTDRSFHAGLFERHRIDYHERFTGFAQTTDTRIAVVEGKRIRIALDGEPLDPSQCRWLDFERRLDLRNGVLYRRSRLRTPAGATLSIDSERFVSLDEDLLAIRFEVTSEDFAGVLTLESRLESGGDFVAQGDDPRIGISGSGGLETLEWEADAETARLLQYTLHSRLAVEAAQAHLATGLHATTPRIEDDAVAHGFTTTLRPGDRVRLEKFVSYAVGAEGDDPQLTSRNRERLSRAHELGYSALERLHADAMAEYWRGADIEVDDDDETAAALRFNLFHLMRSASRNGIDGTAAKGLTGEGYEGHCFWDTEIFALPVMVFTAPEIARAMLMYRHRTLDAARAHARELNHPAGALYAWRTIAGDECSAHYPTGSAAYHINADIAYAIGLYLDATGDLAFLRDAGAEILFETARIWMQIGHSDPLRGDAFSIHGVTGPDEYTALVDNNFYTNRMAQRHLQRAADAWRQLGDSDAQARASLASRLRLGEDEIGAWQRAAAAMRLAVDPALDIYAQDDTFLHKPHWPGPLHVPGRPLLLDHHPMTLYRHQLCKQADVVMALMLAGDGLDRERKRRSFDYYEAITTHDSTLSAAVHGIVAGECGHADKALHYFRQALRVDLDDLHGNTAHGVHMAAMAGSWLGLVWGFGGLRIVDGELRFAPTLPAPWRSYAFGLRWRGRRLRVEVEVGGVRYLLLEGEPLCIRHGVDALALVCDHPQQCALIRGDDDAR